MSNSYTDKYNIIKTFKDDEYQTVLIGSNKENIDDVVVINLLHKDKVSKMASKSDFSNGLDSLLHLEDENEDLVIITEYNDGTPLESYLNYTKTTIKHKINLVYEYITKITKYDVFHNSIKNLLVDESQIMMKDDTLYFNELLFLDENFSEDAKFNVVTTKIAQAIEKILFSSESDEDTDNDLVAKRISKFINRLKDDDHTFQSIEDIYRSFRNIYIYDLFMENDYKLDDEPPEAEAESNPPEIDETEDNRTAKAENNLVNTEEIKDVKTAKIENDLVDADEIENTDEIEDIETPETENDPAGIDEMVDIKAANIENDLVDIDEIEDDEDSKDENDVLDTIEKKDNEKIEINLIVKEDTLEDDSDNSNINSKEEDSYNLYLNDIDAKEEEENYHRYKDKYNDNYRGKRRKSSSYNLKLVIGFAIAILLLIALYKPILNVFNAPTMTQAAKPKAYFEFEKIDDTYIFTNKSTVFGEDNAFAEISWKIYKDESLVDQFNIEKKFEHRFKDEGEYKIVLSIKDKFGNSDEYSENITYINKLSIDELKNNEASIEKLDNLSLRYSDGSIVKDYKAFRSGNYSLMLGEEGKANSEKLIIENLDIENKPIISMWAAASSKEKIEILVRGYKNNSLQFEKLTSFIPKEINTWEMVEISNTTKNIDKLEMVFSNFTSPIWVDDIEVSSYK